MDADLIYRTVPFLSLALILVGWALIELLQTQREDWDLLTVTIVFAGLAGGLYLLSLAINYAPVGIQWREGWFEGIRIALWLTIPGIPIVYVNVWRAFKARRRGHFRRKLIYDDLDPRSKQPDGLP